MNNFENELRELINRYSKERDSNTPDYLLAGFLVSCLNAYGATVKLRDERAGVNVRPGGMDLT